MINLNMKKKKNIIMKEMTKKNTMKKNKCKFCSYIWESRVSNPKSCPLCKRYLIERPEEE